ncbi:MAG TPA: translation elongation factor Ts [Candidatus Goldiibacteriota bacterium]|nr:translation elongation factor Ts [Candidatus Goldiibacteriota bacterium]
MADVKIEQVKELREKSGAGMGDCRAALIETGGDMEKAMEWLRQKGIASAGKRSGRAAKEGKIHAYIHGNGKLGVLVEINCETDFVARTEDFEELCKEAGMQIAAMNAQYVRREDVPADVIAKEKEIYAAQVKESGKPANVVDKIVEGKLEKFYKEVCLLEQAYIKDDKKDFGTYLKEKIGKLGENLVIKRFVRFVLGE